MGLGLFGVSDFRFFPDPPFPIGVFTWTGLLLLNVSRLSRTLEVDCRIRTGRSIRVGVIGSLLSISEDAIGPLLKELGPASSRSCISTTCWAIADS